MSITKIYEVHIKDGKLEWTETFYQEPSIKSFVSSYPYADSTIRERNVEEGNIIKKHKGIDRPVKRYMVCDGCGKKITYMNRVYESFTGDEDLCTDEIISRRVFFCCKKCLTHYFSVTSRSFIEGDPSYTELPWNIVKEESDD